MKHQNSFGKTKTIRQRQPTKEDSHIGLHIQNKQVTKQETGEHSE